jgi:hypothetical protein
LRGYVGACPLHPHHRGDLVFLPGFRLTWGVGGVGYRCRGTMRRPHATPNAIE